MNKILFSNFSTAVYNLELAYYLTYIVSAHVHFYMYHVR